MRRLLTSVIAGTLAVSACGRPEDQSSSVRYGYVIADTTVPPTVPPTQPPDPTVPPSETTAPPTTLPVEPGSPDPVDYTVDLAAIERDDCVFTVGNEESVELVVESVGLDRASLLAENALADDETFEPGDLIDVCIGNGIDDVRQTAREPGTPAANTQLQTALNKLFEKTSMFQLKVDGDAGKQTQQMLCAARAALGLRETTGYLIPGSEEQRTILSATKLSVPRGAPTSSDRWIQVNKTCQVMFAGERDVLIDIYPTSTGAPGYATQDGVGFEAFRFDPALDTNGWHDSTAYPTSVDDPKNGNMYKPIYFNGGEAIHGAGYIPPEPKSKGCARTFPEHQDRILKWLGLDGLGEPTWKTSVVDLRVDVRGSYLTPEGEALPEPDEIIPPAYEQDPAA